MEDKDIQQRLGAVESSLAEVRADVSAIKATLPHLATKADLKEAIGTLRAEMGAIRADLGGKIGTLRGDLGGKIGTLRVDLEAKIGALRADMETKFGELRTEMRAMEVRMIKWFIGTACTLVALVVGIQRYL